MCICDSCFGIPPMQCLRKGKFDKRLCNKEVSLKHHIVTLNDNYSYIAYIFKLYSARCL